MKKLRITLAVGTALIALALTSCAPPSGGSGSASPAAALTQAGLESAAKSEGALTVYSQMPEAAQTALDDAFTAKYGIPVSTTRIGGNDLYLRFESEAQAGGNAADVVIGTDPVAMKSEQDSGILLGWEGSGVADLAPHFPDAAYLADYDFALLQTIDTGFIYNTSKVSESDLPTTWTDLTDAKYKGLLCWPGADTSVANAIFFDIIRDQEGDDVLKGLGANAALTYSDVIAMNEAVASGECGIGLNSASFFIKPLQDGGATVGFAHMPSTYFPPTVAGVATAAKNANAARLYLEFIESEEGNAILNAPGSGSFGPYSSDFPKDFAVVGPDQVSQARDDTDTLVALLGGN